MWGGTIGRRRSEAECVIYGQELDGDTDTVISSRSRSTIMAQALLQGEMKLHNKISLCTKQACRIGDKQISY